MNPYRLLLAVMVMLLIPALAGAGIKATSLEGVKLPECCEYQNAAGYIWSGDDPVIKLKDLAAYAAPILWFSPDEPNLENASGKDIMVPEAFPFDAKGQSPVVYYKLRTVLEGTDGESAGFIMNEEDPGESVIDLREINGFDLDFHFYYASEVGLGGHDHDVETVEMKLAVYELDYCDHCRYAITVNLVNALAHGIHWYNNTLDVDPDTKFPMTILTEEGKHASCTDKNGDGYFTPGYDVNRRINDAWGVRDVIRGGALFTGGFESWFAKVRVPKHRVFPPLPTDSPVRDQYVVDGVYSPDNAVYELRVFPYMDQAVAYAEEAGDEHITRFVDKGSQDWPQVVDDQALRDMGRWLEEENFMKSFSFALRADGDIGVSLVFPLLVVKNVADPMGGGWFVNRIYFKDTKLRDFGYNIMYTTSASRWIDGYFSLGYEWDKEDNDAEGNKVTYNDWVTESGVKLRVNLGHSPFKFLTKLGTDFWGFRIGIKNKGLMKFDEIGYVIEFGGGSF